MKLNLTALQRCQMLVFTVGWLAYASSYCLRKPLGVVKTDLETELSITKIQLGWLDTAFLLPYAVMQMLLGPVGDKFGARRTFGTCLILSGLSMVLFGFIRLDNSFIFFFFFLFLNGTAQAQCWPNCMKTLGSWYPDNVRNSVFGVFGTCAFVGGIVGTALAVWLQTSYGWRSAFLTPCIIVASMGVLVLLFFHQPHEVNMEVPGKEQTSSAPSSHKTELTWLQLWQIPSIGNGRSEQIEQTQIILLNIAVGLGTSFFAILSALFGHITTLMLPEVAVAVFCLKAVRYCMYMWLPMYLLNYLHYGKAQAGMFSTTFEIGGVIGSAVIGIVLDRMFQGRPLLGTALSALLSGLSLLAFMVTGSWGLFFNVLFLALAGGFNCGPDTILGGSVPAELGEMDGRNAAAATVGLVNGFGSVGTFIEGPVIGVISTSYGWSGMFYFMILVTFVGTAAVFRASVIKSRQVKILPDEISIKESLLES